MKLAYTVAEFAKACTLDETTVREMIRTGKIIARRCGGERGLRIGVGEVEKFFATPDPEVMITEIYVATKCSSSRQSNAVLNGLRQSGAGGER